MEFYSRSRSSLAWLSHSKINIELTSDCRMVWFRILLLLFVFIRGALGQTITSIEFEPSFLCSSEFLVTGQDYTVIKYEVSGSNATYQLNNAFSGPQFLYTTTTSNDSIIPCSGFDLGSNACTDRTGEPNACSCDEITSSSVYHLSYNLTADPIFSKQSVWLMWPGSPPMESEIHTLPEVRDSCPTTTTPTPDSTRRFDKWVIPVILAVNIILLVGIMVVLCVISPVNKCDSEWTCGTKALCIVLAAVAVGFLTAFAVIIAEYSDGVENWEKVLNIFGIIVNAVLLVYIFIFIFVLKKGYRICLCLKKPNPKSTQVPLTEDVSANKGKTGIEGNYNNLPDNKKDNQQNSQQGQASKDADGSPGQKRD